MIKSLRPTLFSIRNINNVARTLSSSHNNNYENKYKSYHKSPSHYVLVGTGLATFIGFHIYDINKNRVHAEANIEENDVGKWKENLPTYTAKEVSQHTDNKIGIWVTYKEGVYDVTNFVNEHPGGDQIMIAAGSSVEPFWLLYGIHKNPHVFKILESLRIGNLSKSDDVSLTQDMSDPYAKEPLRHTALNPASKKPFNAETSPALLVENFITPNELFYVRNHLPVPDINPDTYELEIEIEGKGSKIFTLDELKKLPSKTITSTIMCAGNRRSEMTQVKPVKGLNWGPAAIGNAKFTGVPLRDVLRLAGLTEKDEEKNNHVLFEGEDMDATGSTYGASIPIWKALDKRGDVLLAYEMNGVPIPRDHGFPVRVIVPGVVGARNVKWLTKVIVSEKESDSHWQQNDYKGFSPSTDWDTVDFTKSPAIQELPVISAICKPLDCEIVKAVDGYITVKGYAWSGGGQKIVRVDVTGDQGKTWHVANLLQDSAQPPQHWSWTLWTVKIPVDKNTKMVELWAKAVDSSYNTQPETFENIWNLRGVLSNAYHRIRVKVIH
ncbi:sulfite oxidase, mitochondrial isoform X2 [Aethina tumida]|uniref:sulfite oxidase, mitochondrial isoform X1 n=1 Tax=Aethina tumida TaxID=116153 RepID=UPI002147CFD1|nr:sulfite oxidase, mitochondrial isoform X1 [Aethina tumida]XP_049821242.1 sulfite oxidase, mitochondrial isoform X2 [Aethina tumida]